MATSFRLIQLTQPNPRAEEFRRSGAWEERTVTSFLREAARQSPDRLAHVQGATRLTYGQVLTETMRLHPRHRHGNRQTSLKFDIPPPIGNVWSYPHSQNARTADPMKISFGFYLL